MMVDDLKINLHITESYVNLFFTEKKAIVKLEFSF